MKQSLNMEIGNRVLPRRDKARLDPAHRYGTSSFIPPDLKATVLLDVIEKRAGGGTDTLIFPQTMSPLAESPGRPRDPLHGGDALQEELRPRPTRKSTSKNYGRGAAGAIQNYFTTYGKRERVAREGGPTACGPNGGAPMVTTTIDRPNEITSGAICRASLHV